jgi:hypothetical protein
MTRWILKHKTLVLFLALGIIAAGNLALFLPRYLHQSRLISQQELREHAVSLSQIADQGANISNAAAKGNKYDADERQRLATLVNDADSIVLRLQSARHVVPLENQTKETLQLAQIISFALHEVHFSPTDWHKSAKSAQVLRTAQATADGLATSDMSAQAP